MKNLVLIAGAAILLTGCATSGPATLPSPAGPGILSPLVDANIISEATRAKARQVQEKTKGYCGYIPTLGTLVSLFSSGGGESVAALGKAVCDAVTTAPLADGGGRLAYVKGVRIHGRFVKSR